MKMARRVKNVGILVALVLLVFAGKARAYHSSDYDVPNWTISLSELLRAIQFYNVGQYCCDPQGEDGFATGVGDHTCLPHSADYDPQDWTINLSEMLRIIQFYNTGSYHVDSGGEDGFAPGVDPTPSNLTVTSLEVLDVAPQVGHPLKLRVGVESLEEVEGVPIYFFMAAKLLGEPEDYEPEQFLVGSHTIARVVPGRQDFIVDLPIATRVYEGEELPALSDGETVVEPVAEEFPPIRAGTYQLFAQIDPADLVQENDEDDNMFVHQGLVDLADDQRAVPNVVLEKLTLDVPTFALSEPEYQPPCAGKTVTNEKGEPVVDLVNSHVGATAVVSASGSYLVDGVERPIPMLYVQAKIDVPGLGERPVEIYDSQLDSFSPVLRVPSLPFGSKVSVHLDLKLPPWVVEELVTLYREKISLATYSCNQQCPAKALNAEEDPVEWSVFQASSQNECWINCVAAAMGLQGINLGGLLTVTVTPRELVPPYDDVWAPIPEYEPPGLALGNDFQVAVNFLPPAPTARDERSWHEEGTLEKGFSSGGFGAGVEFWGALTFDRNGALAQGSADIPVTIFGSSFDILDFDATAYGSPEHWTEAYYRHDLEFAGFTIHQHIISAAGLEGQTPEWIKPYLTYDEPLFQVGQRKGVNRLIFIGIVPVFASAGVDGYVGFLAQAQINVNEEHFEDWPRLTLSTGPAAGFGAYAGATVEAIIFSVGVQGKVNLLSDTFFYTAGAELDYTPAVVEPPSPALLTAGLWEDVTNRLTGPNGRLTLFADYPTGVRWCKKWGFLYYPCGITRKRASHDLIRFDLGFEKEDVLVCEAIDSLTIPLD